MEQIHFEADTDGDGLKDGEEIQKKQICSTLIVMVTDHRMEVTTFHLDPNISVDSDRDGVSDEKKKR